MTKVTVLKNGLTIITEKKKVQKVCIGVLVKAGLINETDKQNGISHFLEHMAFKGTATKSAKDLAESIESLGGSCNAYTSTDHTLYHVEMLAKYWKAGLTFLKDIVVDSTFPEDELERERKVILQEIARSKDNPMHVFWDRLGSTIYSHQNIGRTILGPVGNIKKFTRKDLKDYVKEYYVPNNMIISASGNVSHWQFVHFVKTLFGHMKAKKVKNTVKAEFIPQSKVFEEIFDQSLVGIVYNGPTKTENKQEVYSIFESILDGGMSCRLFQEVREKNGLCYSTSVINDALKDSGFIGAYAGVKKENVKKALAVMEECLESMKTDITDEELQKAKNLMTYRLGNVLDSPDGMMNLNATSYMYNGKLVDFKKRIKRLNAVTKEEVFEFAKKYIVSDKKATIALVHKGK